MQCGFIVICQDAKIDIHHLCIESLTALPLLSFARSADGWALFWGSLFYHPSNSHSLPRQVITPAATIWDRYSEEGLPGLTTLEGEFALVVRDRRRSRTIALRDPMGGQPLFWVRSGNRLIIGTTLIRIQEQLPSLELNPDYLAHYFASPSPSNEASSRQCAVKQVQRVLPGTMMIFEDRAQRVSERACWDWQAHLGELRSTGRKEAGAIFTDTLRQAVAQRLGTATAAHCSGGMDSSAIALIAGVLLQQQPHPRKLTTISLLYDGLRELAVDRPFLERALAEGEATFTPHYLQADDVLDFDGFADAPPHAEPHPGLWRLGLDRATIFATANQGADTLLTGLGADEVFDQHPFHLANLLKQLRLRTAWREATRWAFADNCSPWEFLIACGWIPFICTAGERLTTLALGIGCNGQQRLPDWLQPTFVKRYDLKGRLRQNIRAVYERHANTNLSVALDAILARRGDFNRWYLGTPLGVNITHPFLDLRVILQGFTMIASREPKPGRMKPLLADALNEILPRAIVARRRKGHFNEVYYKGLARNEEMLQSLVAGTDIGTFIHKPTLSDALAQAALGGLGVSQCRHLNLALCFAQWVAQMGASGHRLSALSSKTLIYTNRNKDARSQVQREGG